MKKLLEVIGGVLAVAGLSGLLYEFTGWFRLFGFMRHLNPFDGYETFWNIALVVAGVAVLAASDAVGKRG